VKKFAIDTVAGLGHDVTARESSLPDVARITATERPDVAIVIVHEGTAKALELIERIVHEAACPSDPSQGRGPGRGGRLRPADAARHADHGASRRHRERDQRR
jgi:hypothetical protein